MPIHKLIHNKNLQIDENNAASPISSSIGSIKQFRSNNIS